MLRIALVFLAALLTAASGIAQQAEIDLVTVGAQELDIRVQMTGSGGQLTIESFEFKDEQGNTIAENLIGDIYQPNPTQTATYTVPRPEGAVRVRIKHSNGVSSWFYFL